MQKGDYQNETLPSEVRAFCHLLARIMNCCLREQDAHFLNLLPQPAPHSPHCEKRETEK